MQITAVTLTVPKTLTLAGTQALTAALQAAAGQVVVVSGRADGFCLGMDLDEVQTASGTGGLTAYVDLLYHLRTAPSASISMVEGPVVGGGVGIAAACDLCLTESGASFALPEALYGFAPAMVAEILKDRLSVQAARKLALRCDAIGAAEALQIGLCDVVFAPEQGARALRRELQRLERSAAGHGAVARVFAGKDGLKDRLLAAAKVTQGALANPSVQDRIARMQEGLTPWGDP